jgi:hypothetical protein
MIKSPLPIVERKREYYVSYLWTYDLYGPVRNAFDAGKSITRASGRRREGIRTFAKLPTNA